jgi:hypothetical protein
VAVPTLRRGAPRVAARLLGCADQACARRPGRACTRRNGAREAVRAGLASVCADAEPTAPPQQGQRWSDDEGFAVPDAPGAG